MNYSLESLSNQFPQLRALVPVEYKQINSLSQFKSELKNWICTNHHYRLSKMSVPSLGYL